MQKKWVLKRKGADFEGIGKKYGISPYLARVLVNRDICNDEYIDRFLNATPKDMHDPALLKDIDLASDILIEAIDAGAPIRIVGDYDIDGVCAAYILEKGLSNLGAIVDVRLPDRIKDGYGINEGIVREAAEDGIELIITCDNGIAAAKEIGLAMELGMSVIITDHHEVPYEDTDEGRRYILPMADAVIDPKRADCSYPFEGICGAMVAYKLICYMNRIVSPDNVKSVETELLSFAAFATVGDVMELRDENRICVKYGLDILRNSSNIGMNALIEKTGINRDKLSAYHIGFILGPCVNATGRLESANKALELFGCEDKSTAKQLAEELVALNEERKGITQQNVDLAMQQVDELYPNDKVLVIYLPECHESIAGLVAGKVREKYYRPTIVITNDDSGAAKGSGRSIETYDMYEELNKVKDLFSKWGGHKMAAGLSLPIENIDILRQRLNINTTLTDEELIEKIVIDIDLPIGYVTGDIIDEIERLAPFGVANPRPVLAQSNVEVAGCRLVGNNKNVLAMTLIGANKLGNKVYMDAILFNDAQNVYEQLSKTKTVSIVYEPGYNEYGGTKSIQLRIKDIIMK